MPSPVIAFLVISSLHGRVTATTLSVKTSDATHADHVRKRHQRPIHDKEQYLELTLKTAFNGHTKIKASYPTDARLTIFNDLQKAEDSTA